MRTSRRAKAKFDPKVKGPQSSKKLAKQTKSVTNKKRKKAKTKNHPKEKSNKRLKVYSRTPVDWTVHNQPPVFQKGRVPRMNPEDTYGKAQQGSSNKNQIKMVFEGNICVQGWVLVDQDPKNAPNKKYEGNMRLRSSGVRTRVVDNSRTDMTSEDSGTEMMSDSSLEKNMAVRSANPPKKKSPCEKLEIS